MPEPQPLEQIAAELRRLRDASPVDESQLPNWELVSEDIDARLRSAYPEILLPIQVMHYLNDGDIRAKDASYREMQNRSMAGIIEAFERGELPASRGTTVSMSPRSVIVVGVFIASIVLLAVRSCH